MTLKAEIAVEMYKAAEHLGAKSDLLRIIGSYGDTMPDEWVLDALKRWNERRVDRRAVSASITAWRPGPIKA